MKFDQKKGFTRPICTKQHAVKWLQDEAGFSLKESLYIYKKEILPFAGPRDDSRTMIKNIEFVEEEEEGEE